MVCSLCLTILCKTNSLLIERAADRFDPDRFLDERLDKYLTPNPAIFIPFNAGPRICLGKEVRVVVYHRR